MRSPFLLPLLLFAAILVAAPHPAAAYPPGWTNDLEVSVRAIDANRPETTLDALGNVHIVWEDDGDDIFYAQVDESGSVVVSQRIITSSSPDDGFESSFPCITHDNKGDLWIFWQDNRTGVFEIYYARSTDNGYTWSRDLPFTALDGFESTHPRAHAKNYGASSRVYVTWQDRRSGANFEVFFRQISYTSAGILTMGADQQATPNDGLESTMPDIFAYKDWIFIAWADMRDGRNEVYFKKSNDKGTTFTGEIPVSENDGFLSQNPRIVANASGVHIVWEDFLTNNFEVHYKKLEHNLYTSNTLIPTKRLSRRDIYDSRYPQIACDETRVDVVWTDSGSAIRDELAHASSLDNGANFITPVILTDDISEGVRFPDVLTMNGNVHIVWARKHSNNHDIFYKGTLVRLLSTTPAINAKGVLTNSAIRMQFSKRMDANSLRNNITVYGDNERVAGTIRLVDLDTPTGSVSQVEFVPAAALRPATLYTVVVGERAKDKNGYSLVGNAMPGFSGIAENDFVWSFATLRAAKGEPVRNVVNSPNPFGNAGTFVNYVIDPADGTVEDATIRIYSLHGRLLRTLANCPMNIGVNQQFFDGRDKGGTYLPNGVYLYKVTVRIDGADCTARGKMLVMRDGCCQ